MYNIKNSQSESKASKDLSSGRNIVIGRLILFFLVIPLFYVVSTDYLTLWGMFKLFLGLTAYNSVTAMYFIKQYPKTNKIPEYFYYVDIVAVSILAFFYGGIHSDVYVIYLFIIALHGARNNKLENTMKVSLVTIGIYSLSCIIAGQIQSVSWFMSSNILKLIVRDIAIIILTYAIGLLISEVKKRDSMHKLEYFKARTDKLTGLPNRHYMEQRLVEELEDCDTHDKVLNVLIFDIDNFKKYNDTHGHLGGDYVLKRFSEILQQSIRKSDLPVRYGGEEFIVLVKDIDFVTAKGVGDRVRRELEKDKIFIDDGVKRKRVTVSCGVAQYPTHDKDITKIIEKADKALYCAKENGKNIVIGYDELLIMEELQEIEARACLKSVN